jgi:hypothetical protein
MQVEYATDLVFRSTAKLGPLYEQLVRQSVLTRAPASRVSDVAAAHCAAR